MGQGKGKAETKLPERLTQFEHQDLEKIEALQYAKENNLWIKDFYTLGGMAMRGGHENTLVLNIETGELFKANNLANSKNFILNLFEAISIHNRIFPISGYEFVGFTGIDNGTNRTPYIEPIFKQKYVAYAVKAEPSEIKEYMESLGFEQRTPESYYNGQYLVSDLHPRNVLKDPNGNLHVVDAMYQEISESN